MSLNCPECKSEKIVKKCLLRREKSKVQQYLCNGCGRRFVEGSRWKRPIKQLEPVRAPRETYSQFWSKYNQGQIEEKAKVMELLDALCSNVKEPQQQMTGRPKISYHDMLFATILKVYSQFSLRRFMGDLQVAKEKGFVEKLPCFAGIGHFMQSEEVTLILQQLILLSALPMKEIETKFAVDSSGFRTTTFNEYYMKKHGVGKRHQFLKAHVLCGVQTNVICSTVITDENGPDSPQFPTLVQTAANNGFKIQELMADKAYSSRANVEVVDNVNAWPFIMFKVNATHKGRGTRLWKKAFRYFQLNKEEFLEHYHKRSNVESTFAAVKKKFGETLRNRSLTAQRNELLCKFIGYNLTVVINQMFELEMDVNLIKTCFGENQKAYKETTA